MDWTPKERAALDELMASRELSERAVVRQALAHYQVICRRAQGTYEEIGIMAKGKSIEAIGRLQRAEQLADDYLMDLCAPGKMSPVEAVDFLGRVIERCGSAIEALKEEHPDDLS